MLGRMMRGMRRRRRRRLLIGGMVVVGASHSMRKMSHEDAQKIEQATGVPPEEMSEEELDAAMQQQGIQAHPVTEADQHAMTQAEAADPEEEE